jgi:peptide/nickel transport system ATP-binding protein
MQMVFQDPLSSLDPRLPVWRIITEPVWVQKRSSERERRQLAENLAQQVGIRPEYLDRLPHAFSGGQRQRIAIARALCPTRILSCWMNRPARWISPCRRRSSICW